MSKELKIVEENVALKARIAELETENQKLKVKIGVLIRVALEKIQKEEGW